MRGASRIGWILLTGLWVASALAWPHLPGRIPVHFDIRGVADRWVDTHPLAWFGLPIAATGLMLLFAGLSRWIVTRPDLINLPDKRRFQALPAEYQEPVIRKIQGLMDGLGRVLVLLFIALQAATYRAARGAPDTPGMILIIAILGVCVPLLVVAGHFVTIQAEVRRQSRRFEDDLGTQVAG